VTLPEKNFPLCHNRLAVVFEERTSTSQLYVPLGPFASYQAEVVRQLYHCANRGEMDEFGRFDATSPYGKPLLPPSRVEKPQPIANLTAVERESIATTNGYLIAAIVILGIIAIAAGTMCLILYLGYTVRYVDGVRPDDGNVVFIAGSSMNIVPSPSTHSILFENTGVGSLAAGPGTTVSTEGGVATVSTTLAEQAQLPESDPNGPEVAYEITMTAVPQNTWRVTTSGEGEGKGRRYERERGCTGRP